MHKLILVESNNNPMNVSIKIGIIGLAVFIVASCKSQSSGNPATLLQKFDGWYDANFRWDQKLTNLSIIQRDTKIQASGDLERVVSVAAQEEIRKTLENLNLQRAYGTVPCTIGKIDNAFRAKCGVSSDWVQAGLHDPDAETPLMIAVNKGDLLGVRSALAAGADVNSSDQAGTTALMLASLNNHESIVELLLKSGANPNKKSKSGNFALLYGAGSSNGIVKALLSAHAYVNEKNGDFETALFDAALTGQTANIKLLLASGADINAQTVAGLTPLMTAAIQGNREAVALLLAKGANPTLRRDNGSTALELAMNGQTRDPKTIQLLRRATLK